MAVKAVKKSIFIILALFLMCALVWCLIHIWFSYVSKWKYNVDDFNEYKQDFANVAEFCIQNSHIDNEINMFYLTNKGIYYNSGLIQAPEEILNSFRRIEEAFPDSDAKFDKVICDGPAVYFTTHNGLYSVVYSPEIAPKTLNGGKAEGTSRKISDGWYHVAKKTN